MSIAPGGAAAVQHCQNPSNDAHAMTRLLACRAAPYSHRYSILSNDHDDRQSTTQFEKDARCRRCRSLAECVF
eukprot:2413731-Rhodomonas_salina.1